ENLHFRRTSRVEGYHEAGKPREITDLVGGARRNRTDDLFNAIEALSQLSYGPVLPISRRLRWGRSSLALRAPRYTRKTARATRPDAKKDGRRRLALHLRRQRRPTSPGGVQPSSSGAMSPSI